VNVAWVRIGLPVAIAVAGVVLLVVGDDAGRGAGVVLVGVAGLVVLANLFVRLSLRSEDDREREARRRDRFSERGRWPDER
jgi:drug/metabolite transporter (DMT)-like permease